VTFDPFGDFESRGYLRNVEQEKDLDIVRRLEHVSFTTGLEDAFKQLSGVKQLSYKDILDTHRTLFEAVYPWAGEDRAHNAPELAVSRGGVLFAHPQDIRRAIDTALAKGQNKDFMRQKPGEVMGYLAFGHPFLDGNGRTIMVMHSVLAQRADISIDWASTNKDEYLDALSQEIDNPGKGILDRYLKPFVKTPIAEDQLAGHVKKVPGLSGAAGEQAEGDIVLGKVSEPAVQQRYKAQRMQREKSESGA
jgi:cell filamentation protein